MSFDGVEERRVRFLLEELPEAEREALEDEFFDRDEAFEELVAAEERLIEEYCDGALEPARAARFESVYLARGDRRRRVELVRALVRRAASSERAPERGYPYRAAAAALAVLTLGALLLVAWAFRRPEPTRELRDLVVERERLSAALERREVESHAQVRRIAELARERDAELARRERLETALAESRRASGWVSLLLASEGTRGDESATRLDLDPAVRGVRLVAPLPEGIRPPLLASVQTPAGEELWAGEALAEQAGDPPSAAVVTLDARRLADGHQVLVLSVPAPAGGARVVGELAFRVVRRP